MFFTVIGWIVVVLALLGLSFAQLLLMLNCLGQHNVSGEANKWSTRFYVVIGGCIIGFLWFETYINTPFF